MTSKEIRNSFLKFFEERGHKIVPSAPVINDNPVLPFINAGMNQFTDVFLGTGKRDYVRAVNSQKCIRVSGKHNDLEEVGRDTYHHTLFEMLGNWSFGDYYKKEAIEWAWELLTKVWRLDKKRLYATVYQSDDEAEQLWKKVTDIDPTHVLQFDKKDNFWEMGETGPCGPCSEIHIDLTDNLSGRNLVNVGDARVMEIWNLVFIQYNRDDKGMLTPLPAKHVDTGMGFERICAVLQGKKSNYDTDVFTPIISRISEIAGKQYLVKLDDPLDIAMRVIADHARMLSFSIADGGIPSNEGCGYVMRRILRRAARFGRTLDIHEPFIYKVVDAVVRSMGTQFPEIKEKQNQIERVIKGEEESFGETLDNGIQLFNKIALETLHCYLKDEGYTLIPVNTPFEPQESGFCVGSTISTDQQNLFRLKGWSLHQVKKFTQKEIFISGEDAFKLYDTYGFPLDLTELMAAERGLKLDSGRFDELMEEQRKRSREAFQSGEKFLTASLTAQASISANLTINRGKELARSFVTNESATNQQLIKFVGYDNLAVETVIIAAKDNLAILQESPFYGESGGQVGDIGTLKIDDLILNVVDTQKSQNTSILRLKEQVEKFHNSRVVANVDKIFRFNIMRNHTATHLVHEALRIVLGDHLHQQGSLVAPDRLRFDFNHFEKITPDQIQKIEDIVNEKISLDLPVYAINDPKDWLPIEEAKRRYPKLKMFFGEKYGDKVRVVEVKDFTWELCGGTHVKNTKDIQLFKIISEASIASGIRRIEAVTGEGLQHHIKKLISKTGEMDLQIEKLLIEKEELEKQLSQFTKVEQLTRPVIGKISFSGTITSKIVDEVEQAIQERESAIETVSKATIDLKKVLGKYRIKEVSSGIESLVANAQILDGMKIVSGKVDVQSVDELQSLGDTLRSKLGSGVGVLGAVVNEKVSLVCVVTDDLIKNKKLQAGKIVGEIAKLVGGGGGGRPHLATAGGKDVAKLDEALTQTSSIVQSMLAK